MKDIQDTSTRTIIVKPEKPGTEVRINMRDGIVESMEIELDKAINGNLIVIKSGLAFKKLWDVMDELHAYLKEEDIKWG